MRPREFVSGNPTILPAIWSRLGTVRAFATAICDGSLNRRVTGHIEGEASPTLDADSRHLRIEERGRMVLDQDNRSFAASNVYCWRFENEGLALDADRSNGRRLEPLVFFRPVSSSVLVSQTPHYCGRDCYWARLQITDYGVVLCWEITGPNKHYGLVTRYTV